MPIIYHPVPSSVRSLAARSRPPKHKTPNYRLFGSHDMKGQEVIAYWASVPLRGDRKDRNVTLT